LLLATSLTRPSSASLVRLRWAVLRTRCNFSLIWSTEALLSSARKRRIFFCLGFRFNLFAFSESLVFSETDSASYHRKSYKAPLQFALQWPGWGRLVHPTGLWQLLSFQRKSIIQRKEKKGCGNPVTRVQISVPALCFFSFSRMNATLLKGVNFSFASTSNRW